MDFKFDLRANLRRAHVVAWMESVVESRALIPWFHSSTHASVGRSRHVSGGSASVAIHAFRDRVTGFGGHYKRRCFLVLCM